MARLSAQFARVGPEQRKNVLPPIDYTDLVEGQALPTKVNVEQGLC